MIHVDDAIDGGLSAVMFPVAMVDPPHGWRRARLPASSFSSMIGVFE